MEGTRGVVGDGPEASGLTWLLGALGPGFCLVWELEGGGSRFKSMSKVTYVT